MKESRSSLNLTLFCLTTSRAASDHPVTQDPSARRDSTDTRNRLVFSKVSCCTHPIQNAHVTDYTGATMVDLTDMDVLFPHRESRGYRDPQEPPEPQEKTSLESRYVVVIPETYYQV